MSTVITSDIYWRHDKEWRVNGTGSGLRTDILNSMLGQLQLMMDYHNKLFVYRFDLHTPTFTEKNTLITDFVRRLFKRIKRHYKLKRIGYFWAREQEKAKQQHYHFALMLDGNKIQHPHTLQLWIEEIWRQMDGSTSFIRYHNFDRSDINKRHQVSYHISYLAKPRGKGKRPIQTKDYGGSRLNPKKTS